MKIETESTKPDFGQTPLDNVKGCCFLAHEKHSPPLGNQRCDDVRDGLAFACSRWTMNHKVRTRPGKLDRPELAEVCIDDCVLVADVEQVVEPRAL